MSDRPALSAVVETINTPPGDHALLLEKLRALDEQTIGRERIEVVVVFDPDVHPGLPEQIPSVDRFVPAPGRHYYAQKNAGVRAASADIVGFTDSDCVPVATWAQGILHAFGRNDPKMACVVGPVRSEPTVMGRAFSISVFGRFQSRRENRSANVAASNSAFRRADLTSQPFEETPVFHGPDVRITARFAEQGRYVLYVPEVGCRHNFVPGLRLFLTRGVYWGWCFLELRRDGSAPYARLFRMLGPIAPLAIVPAKAFVDLRRLAQTRADLDLSFLWASACAFILLINSFAVGIGALRSYLRKPAPPTPY